MRKSSDARPFCYFRYHLLLLSHTYDDIRLVMRLVPRLVVLSYKTYVRLYWHWHIKRCRLIQYSVVITKKTCREKRRGEGKSTQQKHSQKKAGIQPLQSPLVTENKYKLLRKYTPDSRKVKMQQQLVCLLRGSGYWRRWRIGRWAGICSSPIYTSKVGLWKSQLVAAPVLRSHNRSCYMSCNHTTRRTTGRQVERLIARPVVRLESATIRHS